MTDFYNKLGVEETATEQEIKKAYRKLSLEFHPDRNKSPDAQTKFQEIGEAYETLSDASKRSQYDMGRKMGDNPFMGGFPFGGPFPGPFPGGGGGIRIHHSGGGDADINDIFEHFFNGAFAAGGGPKIHVFRNGRPMNQKPPPVEKHIPISLEQSFSGFTMKMEMDLPNGKEIIPIEVPAGIEDNETIVLSNKGNINNNIRGDLHLIFQVSSHDFYIREGLNLYCKKTITLKEALCGFSIELLHLNGKTLRLNNKKQGNIIYPGFKRELPGFGFTRKGESGMLILEFDVSFPTELDENKKKELEAIL